MELLSSSSKNKKIPSKKVLIFFEEMELPCSNISVESFSYISGNGPFLYFRKWNPEKIPYISGNETFLYFGKRTPRKKSLYFRKRNFLIFQETETLKNFLYFRK